MFREDYKKAQDAIQAPEKLRERIREQLDADSAPSLAESFERPKRIWPRVLGYSGAAVAVAALVLLIVRPFALPKEAPRSAEAQVYSLTTAEETTEESVPAAGAMLESKAAVNGAGAVMDAVIGDGDTGMDDYEPYTVPEQTYSDIFNAIAAPEPLEEAPLAEESADQAGARIDEAVTVQDGWLTYGDVRAKFPEGELKTVVVSDARVFVVTEAGDRTAIAVYDESLQLVGTAEVSGTFDNCELRDSTVFGDDALVTRRTFLLYTTWRFDAESAEEDAPETFCPTVTENGDTRLLTPEEITIVNSGDSYAVYLAIVWDDGIEVLYTFAELGL